MSILLGCAYALGLGWLNHVRGGMYQAYWRNTLVWKIIAAVGVVAFTYALTDAGALQSVVIGVLWFAAMLPTWGAWIDAGLFPADYTRGGLLRGIYIRLSKRIASQRLLDWIMLNIRGAYWTPLFIYIGVACGPLYATLFVLPCILLWASSYDAAHHLVKSPNHAEYIAGAASGAMIWMAIMQ